MRQQWVGRSPTFAIGQFPATSSHPISEKSGVPMTGFKVQLPKGDVLSNGPVPQGIVAVAVLAGPEPPNL